MTERLWLRPVTVKDATRWCVPGCLLDKLSDFDNQPEPAGTAVPNNSPRAIVDSDTAASEPRQQCPSTVETAETRTTRKVGPETSGLTAGAIPAVGATDPNNSPIAEMVTWDALERVLTMMSIDCCVIPGTAIRKERSRHG